MKGKSFIEPKFRGIVEGRITQFREVMEPQPTFPYESKDGNFHDACKGNREDDAINPRYKVGETLYLKEKVYLISWIPEQHICMQYPGGQIRYYGGNQKQLLPEHFIRAEHARYFIEITGIRCDRLNDISDGDCEKEGIVPYWEDGWVCGWHNKIDIITYETRRQAYAALIDSINGKGTWERNPYVWVYEFKLLKNK